MKKESKENLAKFLNWKADKNIAEQNEIKLKIILTTIDRVLDSRMLKEQKSISTSVYKKTLNNLKNELQKWK